MCVFQEMTENNAMNKSTIRKFTLQLYANSKLDKLTPLESHYNQKPK